MTTTETDVVAGAEQRRFTLSPPQWDLWTARERYVCGEGAYRSGKTTAALLKVGQWAYAHPGLNWLLSRWTEDATFAQLRPAFLELWGAHVLEWRSDESCYLMPTRDPTVASRVYFRGLRPSEGTSPFSKVHGMTIGCAFIDQPEEIPVEYFFHLQTRLSQPGVPQQLVLTPNPPSKNHWIAQTFPTDNSRRHEGYYYLKFCMRDNVAALGEEYVARAERDLLRNPAEFRRAILGERGVPMKGRPVYTGVFNRTVHVGPVAFNPAVPLIEVFDFGHRHPAVVWLQFPPGELHILGGVMGEDLYIEQFVPIIQQIRSEWFPEVLPSMLWWTCDPAGDAKNSHGTRSAVQILRDFGIAPRIDADANTPPKRDFAIQTLSAYLMRRRPGGAPVCRVDPRFVLVNEHGERRADPVLVDGFEVGYVWDDDHAYQGTQYANLRRPMKDSWYEHPFNAVEYGLIAFAPPDAAEQIGLVRNPAAERRARGVLRARGLGDPSDLQVDQLAEVLVQARLEQERARQERRALRLAQTDDDPFRWEQLSIGTSRGRGGY